MNLNLIAPELSLLILAAVVVFLDLIFHRKTILPVVSVLGLLVPLGFTISLWGTNQTAFNGMLAVDNFSLFFKFVFIGIAIMIIMSSTDYIHKLDRLRGEFYALILLSALGLILLAATRDLISIYVSLELSSMSLYALVTFLRDRKSTEAGVKYLLLGAIASAVLLYGMVITFGMTGTTSLAIIGKTVADVGLNEPALLLGIILIAAGFGFKIAAVPFHMWVPDVYEGAPTPITAYLSVASKAAGFAVIVRIFFTAFGQAEWLVTDWSILFGVLAAITMTVGNVIAIWQKNIKRLLGYSGIAQAGYLMVGLAAANASGQSGVLFFLAAYSLTNLGAFITVIAISNKIQSDEIGDFSGMIKRAPILAAVLAVCLISLTGIPPTAGFMGKLLVFKSAMDAGLLWLVIIAVVNSVISAFYYFNIIKTMFLGEAPSQEPVPSTGALRFTLVVSVIGVFLLGIYPYAVFKFAEVAALIVP
ncbi:MAG: NADH-quinone oxidoreductase subunit N [Dehalococcoidia bacterium]